ncbi:hypothetical protein OAP36_01875 [Planktomarina temperata]|nr:hypothetical protein [Planktomarina temperata]
MVAMVSKMLKNYNYIVQTVLLLALAIGTQGKAETELSPLIFDNGTAACADNGSYSKRTELLEFLDVSTEMSIFDLEISCLKYWLDDENDRNIILISSSFPMDGADKIGLQVHVNNFFTDEYLDSLDLNNGITPRLRPKITFLPVEITKAGDIFPNSYGLHERDVVRISDLTSLIKTDRGLGRLVQSNLQRPINQKNVSVCADHNPKWDPFYKGAIDGLWGSESGRALQKFVKTCQNIEDEITASMITELLLPQLFSLSDVEPNPDSDLGTSEEIESDQAHSENIANQDTESETPATSTPEPTLAAEKDVEGIPVEDPDAGLEHEKEISSLRDKLEEKEAEISQLNESIFNLKSTNDEALADLKKEISKKTIFQIWEDLGIKVNGIMPNGNRMFAETLRQASYGCILSASEGVMKSAVEAYKNLSCYQHTFGDWEIDRSKSFSWDEGEKVITVHLLPQREKYIKSMETAGIIDGLTENSWKTCGIELSLLRDEELVELGEYTGLYSAWDNVGRQGAFLKDDGLESEKVAYEGTSVLINTGKVEDQKCSLPSGIEMPITTGDYMANGSPQALIDRNGHVTIYDLPISAVKGTTLAVFFDTNVGFRDTINYAFNNSLTDQRDLEIHKTYFSAFSQALKDYFKNQSKFENIIIFQSLSEEEAANADTLNNSNFKSIFESEGIDDKKLNKALDEFESEFTPGQMGSFSDKRREIQVLLKDSGPIELLSFGPSGLDYSEVCNVEKRMRSSQAITIFDVWTADTLDELLRTEQLGSRRLQLVNNCANNEQIFGLKVSLGRDQDDISRSVLEYLNRYLGRQ